MKIKFYIILLLIKFFTVNNFIYSQEIPNEFFLYKTKKIINDTGFKWDNITTFGPLREIFSDSLKNDSLKIKTRIGLLSNNNNLSIYGYEHFSFKKYFYAFLYARIVNNPNAFPRYSGIAQEINRAGFTSGETDLSGIGFENHWSIIQIGRGRQSWGAGNDIQLAISDQSPSYDYGLIGLNFKKLRYRYFHAFLESDSIGINRYLTAKGIEYSNLKSMVISLSEITIYSGLHRPLDFTYLNPLSSHLEIELNDRQNVVGTDNGNAVWQASLDWFLLDRFRFSCNLLFDELVFDKSQRILGKRNRTAFSSKISYHQKLKTDIVRIIYLSILNVDPLTFRHGNGSNNFVTRERPLGWRLGSDSYEIKLGLNQVYKMKTILRLQTGYQFIGNKSILYDSYINHFPYYQNNNLSKILDAHSIFMKGHIEWWIKPEISIQTSLEWVNHDSKENELDFRVGINIFLPHDFLIK